jgi:hypothetical protein
VTALLCVGLLVRCVGVRLACADGVDLVWVNLVFGKSLTHPLWQIPCGNNCMILVWNFNPNAVPWRELGVAMQCILSACMSCVKCWTASQGLGIWLARVFTWI